MKITAILIDAEVMHTFNFLKDKNIIKPPPGKDLKRQISTEKRQRLSKILGDASNNRLSEIVIEDRGII